MYSDLEEVDEYESEFTHDDFLDGYKDDVLYMLEDMKSRFKMSPFFMTNVNLPILTNFFINQIIKRPTLPIINNHIFLFNNYYKQELEISYNIVSKFIKRFKIISPYNYWLYFCYRYSDLYEIQKYA